MKTMKWLLRREFWEHKGAFFWAPAVTAALMLLAIIGAIVYGIATGHVTGVVIGGRHAGNIMEIAAAMPREVRAQMAAVAARHYLAVAVPLFAVLPVVVFFYCLGALHDDRRDRSILFWKSLPVSDRMTVLSKVITAVCVAPLITIALGTATALIAILFGAAATAYNGVNLFGALFTSANLYLAPLYLLGLLPVYILWALPTVGWLLMVSSWARSKVFLWAVGIPLIVLVLLKWFNFMIARFSDTLIDTHAFMVDVMLRGLGGLIPGVWLPFSLDDPGQLGSLAHGLDLTALFTQSWLSLANPGVWGGAVAGVVMIAAAIQLRRWRDEG
jgi:ABC-2 type transport system permease protein